MRIAIINTLPIPSGQASVNRLLSYGKGLVNLGNDVSVLSSGKSNIHNGCIDNVKYQCFGHKGNIGALFEIISEIKHDKYDIVILVSNSLLLIYPVVLVCKIWGSKILLEKSEFPFVLMKSGIISKLYAYFYINTTYKLFDGLIVMTKPLMNYFRTKVRKSAKLFEMPMTVDTDRFSIDKTESIYGDYIAYCGDMAGNKDGVQNLIDAYNIACEKMHGIKLLLIGSASNPDDFIKIKKYAESLHNDGIIFYGKADRTDIPQLLVNARALALARPSGLQSTGGFPTKLGEYLSTGNPVIVTKVGDIPSYLNSSNSFVVEPDNNIAFADTIVSVFGNYKAAQEKALKGKKLAYSVFSASIQSNRLNKFLNDIK